MLGGATYCAVSALLMMGYITFDASSGNYSSSAVDVNALIKWCIQAYLSLYVMIFVKHMIMRCQTRYLFYIKMEETG